MIVETVKGKQVEITEWIEKDWLDQFYAWTAHCQIVSMLNLPDIVWFFFY